jgi:hypothetical protein
MEIKKEVEIYAVKTTQVCDHCKEGEMLPVDTSLALTTYPVQYSTYM